MVLEKNLSRLSVNGGRKRNKMKNHKIKWQTKAALICLAIAMLILIASFFYKNLKEAIWAFILLSFLFDFWAMQEIIYELQNQVILKDYEIDQLRYSYIQMGKYVDKFEFRELSDINFRIANELNDIEVKKKWYAEGHGIKIKE